MTLFVSNIDCERLSITLHNGLLEVLETLEKMVREKGLLALERKQIEYLSPR